MLRVLLGILLAMIVYLGLFYMENFQPELMNSFLIKVDIFNITQAAKEEHKRIEDIKDLTIPYEEKQVLVNRTVFMGASQDMVRLALGEPRKTWVQTKYQEVYYVYFLPNDKRPTIFVFETNKLIKAYRGSALDTGTIY